jgi:hypothetical protein
LDRFGREVYPERNEMEPKEVQEEEQNKSLTAMWGFCLYNDNDIVDKMNQDLINPIIKSV